MPLPEPKDTTSYVVYWCQRYQDSTEEGAKVVTGLDAALACATRLKRGNEGENCRVQMFLLGTEVPLKQSVVTEKVVTENKTIKVEVA